MGALRDLAGQRFGILTALEYTHRELSSGRRMPAWRMRCDCGNEVVAMTVNLTKGKHQSCGCKRQELVCKARGFQGDTKRPEYRVYRQMLDRCYLESAPNYRWYGAKGVTVCDRWRRGTNQITGFQAFIEDMGPRPAGLTLERDDPSKPYEPSNCRWATWQEQAANKREHRLTPIERAILNRQRGDSRRGSKSPRAILTEHRVAAIKKRIAAGARTSDLAAEFGVAPQTICGIKAGRNWSHVDPTVAGSDTGRTLCLYVPPRAF
jgi:hypothetical protein